jgi:hypothetical protein
MMKNKVNKRCLKNKRLIRKSQIPLVLKTYGILIILLMLNVKGISQLIYNDQGHIPYQYQTDWRVAGLLPNTPITANNIFDITLEPGTSWDEKVNSALNKAKIASGTSIIYFPGGQTYVLEQPIVLTVDNGNNIIFQGDGAGSTILQFNMPANNNCFDFRGEVWALNANLTTDLLKREKIFTVDNANGFNSSDWIHLEQPNFDYSQSTSWRASIGQITQIADKTGNTITIKDEANKEYLPVSGSLPNDETKITLLKPIQNVGIENLKISRLGESYSSNSELGHNVYFKYAVNCWVKGVEMERTAKHHVGITQSSHIEISGCFIHRSIYYGSGGYGYGVRLSNSTTNCLIENNVFRRLRHAMLISTGANCNVFSYNYSREQYWTGIGGIELPQGSDLVLHGGYAFSNLFEQNIVEQIEADVSYTNPPFSGFHGINGPFNAFIRNFATEGNPANSSDIRDLILKNAPLTSVLGCVIADINTSGITTLARDLFGREVLQNQTYETGANISHPGGILDLLGILTNINLWLADVSYYYSSKPDFLGTNFNFPTLGPGDPFTSNFPYISHIPASDRWYNSNVRFVTAEPTKYLGGTLSKDITLSGILYITTDITIPANHTLTFEPNTIVIYADKDTITMTINGSLVLGSSVQFETGNNGNTQVVLTGSQTLSVPSSVSFQIKENSGLEFNMSVDINSTTFIAEANSKITSNGGGNIANSLFIKEPSATIRLKHDSNILTITNSEFRYP